MTLTTFNRRSALRFIASFAGLFAANPRTNWRSRAEPGEKPSPISTAAVNFEVPGWGPPVTAIARHWDDGDTAGCKLCPECVAKGNFCLLVVGGHVQQQDAAAFDATAPGFRWLGHVASDA